MGPLRPDMLRGQFPDKATEDAFCYRSRCIFRHDKFTRRLAFCGLPRPTLGGGIFGVVTLLSLDTGSGPVAEGGRAPGSASSLSDNAAVFPCDQGVRRR